MGPTALHSRSSNQGDAQISTSTVAALGGGFIAFAFFLGAVLTLIRMARISLRASQRRERGEQVTFAQQWEWEGGLWGFLFGVSPRHFQDNGLPRQVRRARGEQTRDQTPRQKRPEWMHVQVPCRGTKGVLELQGSENEPLSIVAAGPSDGDEPQLDLAVFIILPTPLEHRQPKSAFNIDDDEYDDLAEVVIGTASVQPIINVRSADRRASLTWTLSDDLLDCDDKGKAGATVEEVEFVPSEPRRVRWIKDEKQWTLEGL